MVMGLYNRCTVCALGVCVGILLRLEKGQLWWLSASDQSWQHANGECRENEFFGWMGNKKSCI